MASTEPCPSLPEGSEELVVLFSACGVTAVAIFRVTAEKRRGVHFSSTQQFLPVYIFDTCRQVVVKFGCRIVHDACPGAEVQENVVK